MTDVVTFVAGIAGLLVAANLVVSGASQIGIRFGLSPAVVGLTILAFGTSAPELAVVGQSVAADDTELAVGGIIGSNIANILLVVGLIAALRSIRVESRVVTTDVPIMIGASFLFLVFALDSTIGRGEALILLMGIVGFTVWTIRSTRNGSEVVAAQVDPDPGRPEGGDQRSDDGGQGRAASTGRSPRIDTRPIPWLVVQVLIGIGGLALAAQVVVGAAENIAAELGVPELIVGLTIVAIGTSAPEIVTSVVAALRGQADLAVGNAFGSNIFNIMFVLGAVGFLSPRGIAISDEALALDVPVMLAAAVACIPVLVTDHILRRWEGLVFLGYYVAYIAFLVLDAADHDASDDLVRYVGWIAIPLTLITFATVAVRHLRRGSTSAT